MIILSGGAGFIGSNLLKELNNRQIYDIVIVDDIDHSFKPENLENSKYREIVPINNFWQWEEQNKNLNIDTFFHLGACSDTLETDKDYLYENNVVYSQRLWQMAIKHDSNFIYASSAATYGIGDNGFDDNEKTIDQLKPLNEYGKSKNNFDLWAINELSKPPFWVGLKFFNVYGPYEDNKGKMASVVHWGLRKVHEEKEIRLFKSLHSDYKDGYQTRDFIFIEDVVDIIFFFKKNNLSGIFNVGTGNPQTFLHLAENLFESLSFEKNIKYIDMPEELIDIYQYYTCANINKLRSAGYNKQFTSLKKGVEICKNYFLNTIK